MRKQYHFRTVGADVFIWDVHKLARLARSLTPELTLLSQIAELDEDWWFRDGDDLPTPRNLAAHMRLFQASDLAHPIILCADGRLMDGMHRAVNALLEGRDTILAVQLPETPAPDFRNVTAGDLSYEPEDI